MKILRKAAGLSVLFVLLFLSACGGGAATEAPLYTNDYEEAPAATAMGREVVAVRITELKDGVFYAVLDLGDGLEVSARPSDAIAVALRTGSPLFGAPEVLDSAGIEVPEEEEQEVEAFREFLDTVSPEDFEEEGNQS